MVNSMIALSIVFSSLAQVALKKGMLDCNCSFALETSNIVPLTSALVLNPFVVGGVTLHVLALISWLYVLKHTDVSYAYPFISLGFVLVLLFGYFVFNESINLTRLVGIAFIITGIIIVGRSTAAL